MEHQITFTTEQCRLLLDWAKVNKEADCDTEVRELDTPTLTRIRKNWSSIIKKLKKGAYGPGSKQ